MSANFVEYKHLDL